MHIIKIKNLQAFTTLGVFDWEKEAKRRVVLNITLHIADDRAGGSDDLKDAVDYNLIEQRVTKRLDAASYNLIERLVVDMAGFILSLDSRIAKIFIEADKPGALRQSDSVSVSFTLDRPSR